MRIFSVSFLIFFGLSLTSGLLTRKARDASDEETSNLIITSPIVTSAVFTSPVFTSPVFSSPLLTSPVLTSRVLPSPVLPSPVLPSPVLFSPAASPDRLRTFGIPSSRQISATDCASFYNAAKVILDKDTINIITAISLLPESILILVAKTVMPTVDVDYLKAGLACWRSQTIVSSSYRAATRLGMARLDNARHGELFFTQTSDSPTSFSVIGNFKDLAPSTVYAVKVHKSGDISQGCSNVGEEFSTLGSSSFTTDSSGRGVLLKKRSDMVVGGGGDGIMGRSIVITPTIGGKRICGVIIRNVLVL